MKFIILMATILFPLTLNAATITSISVTTETQEGGTALGGVLSVSAPPYPLDPTVGAGLILNPSIPFFGIHSHIYDAANIPANAVITFGFSEPAVVDSLLVNQHTNGLTRIEGFVGDSLSALSSIGNIFGPDGDVEATSYFSERSDYVFDFNNTTAGLYYQFVITKTSYIDGYAAYNLRPRDSAGQLFAAATTAPVPLPAAAWLFASALAGFGVFGKRRSHQANGL